MTSKISEQRVMKIVSEYLDNLGLDYKIEEEQINLEIEQALKQHKSKNGGIGGNRPDFKLIINDGDGNKYVVIIECKANKNKIVKYSKKKEVDNTNNKYIKEFAVNGAFHYANIILQNTNYNNVIAIGITGGEKENEIKVLAYLLSKENGGMQKKIGEFKDLSFLDKKHFKGIINKIINKGIEEKEIKIEKALKKIHNEIFNKDKNVLKPKEKMHIILASILSTIPMPDNDPPVLKVEELDGNRSLNYRDGDKVMKRVEGFLDKKIIPKKKKEKIIHILKKTLSLEKVNKTDNNGYSFVKEIFLTVNKYLAPFYKNFNEDGLTIDFTGKLFNEMYNWFRLEEDTDNNIVLTPPYVSKLLVELARVNKDSYVWDVAMGTGSLLIASMNKMIEDAEDKGLSIEEIEKKKKEIKEKQIFGIELEEDIYILAVLNMIMMGDGSANLLNRDSLEYLENEKDIFPANRLVINPPYTNVEGKGMIFIQKAFERMRDGYGVVIIQNSAGSGQAKEINKEILKNNTLLASIKMPIDLFKPKADVATYIYVFKIGEPHDKDSSVKFINFSNDGYKRTDRKKGNKNLKDVDNAKARYEELIKIVKHGKKELKLLTDKDYYEATIDPESGEDWNWNPKLTEKDLKPTIEDFENAISEYISWEIKNII